MKNFLLLITTIFTSTFGFSQSNVATFSTSAADELNISTSGQILNKDATGTFTAATITITITTDFTGSTDGIEPTYGNAFNPFKLNSGSGTNTFRPDPLVTLRDNNTTTSTLEGTVRTRTWTYGSLEVQNTSVEGNTLFMRVTGGKLSGSLTAPNLTGVTVGNIPVVNTQTLSNRQIKKDISSSVYPNPVTEGTVTINVKGADTYTILDIVGQVVLTQKATGTIDVSGLTSGIYILTTEVGTTKLIIE